MADEAESLFDGMDFVSPELLLESEEEAIVHCNEPTQFPGPNITGQSDKIENSLVEIKLDEELLQESQEASVLKPETHESFALVQSPSESAVLTGPLDESLFSVPIASEPDTLLEADIQPQKKLSDKEEGERLEEKEVPIMQSTSANRKVKKKHTTKIGYARESEEPELAVNGAPSMEEHPYPVVGEDMVFATSISHDTDNLTQHAQEGEEMAEKSRSSSPGTFQEVNLRPADPADVPSSSSQVITAEPVQEAGGDVARVGTAEGESEAGGEAQAEDEGGEVAGREQEDVNGTVEKEEVGEERRVGDIAAHLASVLDDTSRQLSSIRLRQQDLAAERKVLSRRRRDASLALSTASARVATLEVQLAAACECEDFEAADALSGQLAAAEREQGLLLVRVQSCEEAWENVERQVVEAVEEEARIGEEGARKLREIQQSALSLSLALKEESASSALRLLESLAAQEASVDARWRKSSLEERVLREEESSLEQKRQEAGREEQAERDALLLRRAELDAELAALREQVAAKEAEVLAQDSLLVAVEARMSAKCARFDTPLAEVREALSAVLSARDSLEAQARAVAEQKQAVENSRLKGGEESAGMEAVGAQAEAAAQEMMAEAEKRRRETGRARAVRDKVAQLAARDRAAGEAAEGVRGAVKAAQQEMQDVLSVKAAMALDMAGIQNRVSAADKRLPELEADKKAAASARNFKEAARLAAEAKAVLADREAAAGEVGRLQEALVEVEEEERGKVVRMAELEEELRELERKAAMAKCARLRLVALLARQEVEAAVEMEDFEEADSLNLEAESADEEADALKKLYSLEGSDYDRREAFCFDEEGGSPEIDH